MTVTKEEHSFGMGSARGARASQLMRRPLTCLGEIALTSLATSWPLACGLLIGLASTAVRADIFKYVDASGHVHYTDRPNHSGFKLLLRSPPPKISSTPLVSRSSSPRFNAQVAELRDRFSTAIQGMADRYALDPALLHAVIRAESGYNPRAVSPKGAVGLMQLMPGTAARYGVDNRLDPEANLDGGAHYLSDLLKLFGDDVRLAVAAYNAGENAVLRAGTQIPAIAETQNYVARVINYYQRAR